MASPGDWYGAIFGTIGVALVSAKVTLWILVNTNIVPLDDPPPQPCLEDQPQSWPTSKPVGAVDCQAHRHQRYTLLR